MLVRTNETDLITSIQLVDDDGDPIEDVEFDDVNLEAAYKLANSATWVVLTLVDGTIGTYLSESFKHDENNIYQICWPNEAIVGGTITALRITYGANRAQYDTLEAFLPDSSELEKIPKDGDTFVHTQLFNDTINKSSTTRIDRAP